MIIADKASMTNPSSFLGKLPLNVPMGVMGILVVVVLPFLTAATEILISPNMPLSIVPSWMYVFQAVHFSVFPSLSLFILLSHSFVSPDQTKISFMPGIAGGGTAGKGIRSPGSRESSLVISSVLIGIQYLVKNRAARISHKSGSWIDFRNGMTASLRKPL